LFGIPRVVGDQEYSFDDGSRREMGTRGEEEGERGGTGLVGESYIIRMLYQSLNT